MVSTDDIFRLADQAVGEVALDLDPGLASVWRDVTPEAIGLDSDNWLATSKQMVVRFNELAVGVAPISISEPARRQYYDRDLIDFVGAIADAAEQVA